MNQYAEDHGERELFVRAKAAVIKERQESTSLLQRRLVLGYSKALHLIARLEQDGVVTKLNAENSRTLTSAYMTHPQTPGWFNRRTGAGMGNTHSAIPITFSHLKSSAHSHI